jgi:UDP-N-acetylglucosamine 2-epimerase (non-hydrolysing)
VTVTQGTNVLAGVSKETIVARTQSQLERGRPVNAVQPPLWDGKAAKRIVDVLMENND